MKKILSASVVLLLTLTGCIFSSEDYKARATYDFSPDRIECSGAVNRIRIKNSSGADRRFLYRTHDNRMLLDEYNVWMLDPEQLMRRVFDVSFSNRSKDAADVSCTIERFEFDLTSGVAGMQLAVSVEKDGRSDRKLFVFTEKMKKKNGASAAYAMDKCAKAAVKKVDMMIKEFAEKKKVEK